MAGVNSSTIGYWGGGFRSSFSKRTQIDGINFSTEIATNPTAGLSIARDGLTGIESTTDGYFCGGDVSKTIDKFTFSTEAITTPSAVLSTQRSYNVGVNNFSKGFIAGGSNTTNVTAIDGFTFSTETSSVQSASLTTSQPLSCGVQSGGF